MLEAAHQELRRMERQSSALSFELSLYQKSLAEHAESLVEKEALRRQSEHQSDLLTVTLEQLSELQQQLQTVSQREQDQQKRWQRVPRWVCRLLGVA